MLAVAGSTLSSPMCTPSVPMPLPLSTVHRPPSTVHHPPPDPPPDPVADRINPRSVPLLLSSCCYPIPYDTPCALFSCPTSLRVPVSPCPECVECPESCRALPTYLLFLRTCLPTWTWDGRVSLSASVGGWSCSSVTFPVTYRVTAIVIVFFSFLSSVSPSAILVVS